MSAWRARRQFIVILVIVIIIGGISFPKIKKLIPVSTCEDNKKNQGEVEIDCGGPCGPCELKHPQNIVTFWARSVQVRENSYDVAAYIQNPNDSLSSDSLEYEFTLFDSLGVIARKEGKTFIYPGEKTYVVEANLKTTREPNYVEFKVIKAKWRADNVGKPGVAIDKKEYHLVTTGKITQSIIDSGITNRTSVGFRRTEVLFVILDESGNLVGTNRTEVDNLLARSSQTLRATWPDTLKGAVSTIIAEPRINLFEPNIILKPL